MENFLCKLHKSFPHDIFHKSFQHEENFFVQIAQVENFCEKCTKVFLMWKCGNVEMWKCGNVEIIKIKYKNIKI